MHSLGNIKKMNAITFKKGDRVIYSGQYEATVIKTNEPVPDDNNIPGALIEFDDQTLIPTEMLVPYSTINHLPSLPTGAGQVSSGSTTKAYGIGQDPWCYGEALSDKDIDVQHNCPKCGSPWKETWIAHWPYYDCLKCDIKREDVWKDE